jgi:iron complex outermembrane receptor protein
MKTSLKQFSIRPILQHVGRAVACMAATAMLGASPAFSSVLEEVVVTAQKREQNLQDVGIAVTAFTGKQLNELGFTNAIDVVAQSPGLEVSGSGGGTITTFTIRGVTQNDFSPAQEGPVAVYVDEAYISQNSVTNFSLFDLDRVEVLRGPQGTLFGRNATGGLVHYITKKPTQEPEGFADAQVGEEGRVRAAAAASGGLTDTISARIAGVYNKSDGLIENEIGPDVMDVDDYSVRGQLLFEPSDELNVLLKAQYGNEDDRRGGYAHQVGFDGVFSKDPTATDFFGYRSDQSDPLKGSFDFNGYRKVDTYDLAAHVDWDIGDYTLNSVTNYQNIEHQYGEDSDVSPNSVYNYEADDNVDQWSQELRLNWEGDRYHAVVGLFYLYIDADYASFQSGDVFFGPGFVYGLDADQETETFAVFAQTEFDLTDTLALTVGLRLNRDEKDYKFLELGAELYSDDFTDDDWSGKIQLDYRPNDDWLLYAGVNRGIKSGGFNLPLSPPADFSTFKYDGETLYSYEAGFKSSLTDSTRLNMSVYYYDYEDYQAYTFDGFVSLLFNANADMKGGEIELVTSPIEGLDMMFGVAYLDAEVKDVPLTISPTGKEDAVLAPEWSYNALVRYGFPAFNGEIALQADYSWKDSHNFNLAYTPVIEEDSYGIANARVSYTTEDEAWTAAVFVKNLTDEEYRSFAFDTTSFFGATENVPGIERWWGANVRYQW